MDVDAYTGTRRALHGVAELLLAGPQYRRTGEIRLRVLPGGFGTFAEPDVRVDGAQLVHNGRRLDLSGTTLAELAARAGLDVGRPEGVYHDGCLATPDDAVHADPDAAAFLAACFAVGDAALRALDLGQEPILWPEHFDVGIVLDAVNYGVSAGDDFCAEPYAYVGPHDFREAPDRYRGGFWTAPFGAARPVRELPGDALGRFFADGRRR
jgi:hypothetical protein